MKVPFALGILHTPVGKYALRMANVQTATDLTTAYDGNIPSGKTWGNAGGIVLGVGGDNSNNSWGTFYEGAVTNGSPSNATDLARHEEHPGRGVRQIDPHRAVQCSRWFREAS